MRKAGSEIMAPKVLGIGLLLFLLQRTSLSHFSGPETDILFSTTSTANAVNAASTSYNTDGGIENDDNAGLLVNTTTTQVQKLQIRESERGGNTSFPFWSEGTTSTANYTISDSSLSLISFTGSSMELPPPSPGIDVYSHVCLVENPWELYSYGRALESTGIDRHGWHIFKTSTEKPIDDWWKDSGRRRQKGADTTTTTSRTTYIANNTETLFLVDLFGSNPGHCLNDVIFSLIHLRNMTTITTTSNTVPSSSSSSLFPSYAYGLFYIDPKFQRHCTSWCCQTMRTAGLIPKTTTMTTTTMTQQELPLLPVFPADRTKKRRSMMCFDRLVVPHFGEQRYGVDPNSLLNFRNRLVRNTGGGALRRGCWEEEEIPPQSSPPNTDNNRTTLENNDHKKVSILLYNRRGTSQRIYNNSQALVDYLESNYHVSIHHLGQEWNDLNVTEQAALYNSYRYIVAPHGAHFVNLLYTRPGTKVVEIQCQVRRNAKIQKRNIGAPLGENKNDTSRASHPRWYGLPASKELEWFTSFTHILDIEHFVFIEKKGCALNEQGELDIKYSPPSFHVNPGNFGDYVAVRFGLLKK